MADEVPYTWLGGGFYTNYLQGTAAGKKKVPNPRNGDTYLCTDDGRLYTYMNGKWNLTGGE